MSPRTLGIVALFASIASAGYSATVVVTNATDVVNGDITSPTTLANNPGPDGISLREAILACDNVPGPNSITFDPSLAGQTINLGAGLNITQDGITLGGLRGSDGSPAVTLVAPSVQSPIFSLYASNFALEWLRIDGTNGPNGQIALAISISSGGSQDVDDVLVQGNVFLAAPGSNQTAVGLSFPSDAANASISNVSVIGNTISGGADGVGAGIIATGCTIANLTVEGNSFTNIINGVEMPITDGGTNNTFSGTVIARNTFAGNVNAIGIGISDYPDYGTSSGNVFTDTTIEQNVMTGDTAHGITLAGGSGNTSDNQITNTLIENNVITGSQSQPPIDIFVNSTDSLGTGQGNSIVGVSIINNTIAFNQPLFAAILSQGAVSGIILTNDILWQNSNGDVGGVPFANINNCIITDPGYAGSNGNIDADPQFVDSATGDLHLMPGSPAIGAGTAAGAPGADLEGRPRTPGIDIGAYQYDPDPVIVAQPQSTAVASGGSATLTVGAVGPDGPTQLSYQWQVSDDGGLSWLPESDGDGVSGSATATLTINTAVASLVGDEFECVATNGAGSATSEPATLLEVQAMHSVTYVDGYFFTISNTITYAGTPTRIDWQVTLPGGWQLVSQSGDVADMVPGIGSTGPIDWTWTTSIASNPNPITFSYVVEAPFGSSGTEPITQQATVTEGGVPTSVDAEPDPLMVNLAIYHSADTAHLYSITVSELTRVVALYNTRSGTILTGCYLCDTSSADGFNPDPSRPTSAPFALPYYHSADFTNQGNINVAELTRVVSLYNYRAGTVLTGAYHVDGTGEDGFNPGP